MLTVAEAVTGAVAIYGAVLSSYILYRNMRSARNKLSVTYGWSYSVPGPVNVPQLLELEATNTGRHDMVVFSLRLDIPRFCRITPAFLDKEGNKEESKNRYFAKGVRLKPGDQISATFDYAELKQFIERMKWTTPLRVRAVCEDTLENYFFGSWFEIGKD